MKNRIHRNSFLLWLSFTLALTATVTASHEWRGSLVSREAMGAGIKQKNPASESAVAWSSRVLAFVHPASPAQGLGQTFIVTNTNDSGAGSLRQAIIDSNLATTGTNTISFSIDAAGVQTITPLSALPDITQPVIIDGYTQTIASANTLPIGDSANLLIELNGADSGGVIGLHITAGNSTIKGLVINRFLSGGIQIDAGGNTIAGNFIGTDAAGASALASQVLGVFVHGSNNIIGGTNAADRNVGSGNGSQGVDISGAAATNNVVQGNYVGTNKDGTVSINENSFGILVESGASNNLIGGTTGTTPSGACTGACNLTS